MKPLYTIGGFGLVLAVCLFGVWQYGEAKYREGRKDNIIAQQKTDIEHATATMEKQNTYYAQAVKMASMLTNDGTVAGPDLSLTIDSLRRITPPRKPGQ